MSIDNTDALEAVKKNIKRIRRSGAQAEIFGWALLLVAAAALWLAGSKMYAVIVFGAFAAIGLFFVCSGKYIKDGFGRRTKLALLANSIAAFPLSFGVLPLYIYVQSSNNYTRFKDLPDKIQLLFNKPKRLRIGVLDIIIFACLVGLGSASLVFKLGHLDTAAAAHKISNSPAQPAPPVSTLSKYRFTITAPGSVSTADFTEKVSGHDVSYTTYSSTAGKGAGDYKVYAYNFPEASFHYSSIPQNILAATVHSSLSAIVQELHGTIVSSSPSVYAGHASEDGEFTCQTFAGTRTGYARVLFIENYGYGIISIGASRDAFDKYADSFQFKGV